MVKIEKDKKVDEIISEVVSIILSKIKQKISISGSEKVHISFDDFKEELVSKITLHLKENEFLNQPEATVYDAGLQINQNFEYEWKISDLAPEMFKDS